MRAQSFQRLLALGITGGINHGVDALHQLAAHLLTKPLSRLAFQTLSSLGYDALDLASQGAPQMPDAALLLHPS
jgi:hypothetical protein